MIKGIYKWKDISAGLFTPGGDPVFCCPNCGGDKHIYGIEFTEKYHHECKECRTKLIYPWEDEECLKS